MIICYSSEKSNSFIINGLKEELILDNIHYKYNFRIQPFKINENIDFKNQGTNVKLIFPVELDFTVENDGIILYIMPDPSLATNIRLNPDSSELKCKDLYQMKICYISLIHFINKKTGYYYTHHSNHLDKLEIYHDSSPIKVIVPEKIIEINIIETQQENKQYMSAIGMLYFKTNFYDTNNIFDAYDIEKSTIFNTLLTDEYKNTFEIICRLWKPFDNNLIIICETQDNMNPKNLRTISVIFKESFFNYGEHKIFINSKITLKLSVLDILVPF